MKKMITLAMALVIFSSLVGVARATSEVQTVPDASSTSALMGMALVGLAAFRRFVR